MVKSIQGIYRNGKIEISEMPKDIQNDTPVIVTFLDTVPIDLRERGIDKVHAADLRVRLAMFSEEWDSPEMDAYDSYDDAKANS